MKTVEAQLRCFNIELLDCEIRAQDSRREQGKVTVFND